MVKAVKIDPVAKIVTDIEYDGYDGLMKHMTNIDCITLVPVCRNESTYKGLVAYGDDEGLLKPDQSFTQLPWYPEPIAGVVVCCGMTPDGEDADCPLTAFTIAKEVHWLTLLQL